MGSAAAAAAAEVEVNRPKVDMMPTTTTTFAKKSLGSCQ